MEITSSAFHVIPIDLIANFVKAGLQIQEVVTIT